MLNSAHETFYKTVCLLLMLPMSCWCWVLLVCLQTPDCGNTVILKCNFLGQRTYCDQPSHGIWTLPCSTWKCSGANLPACSPHIRVALQMWARLRACYGEAHLRQLHLLALPSVFDVGWPRFPSSWWTSAVPSPQ